MNYWKKLEEMIDNMDMLINVKNSLEEDIYEPDAESEIQKTNNSFDLTSLDLMKLAALEIDNNNDLELLDVTKDNEIVFALNDDDYLEAFEKEYNIDIDLDTSNLKKNPCPSDVSIVDFRKKLTKINKYVYKKTKKEGFGKIVDLNQYKVICEYSLFLGKNMEPFDSSEISKRFEVVDYEKNLLPLPGIVDAVATMRYQEDAVFWLSYEVMYGKLGIISRIPPKSNIIAHLKIKKLFDHDGNEIKPEMTRFERIIESVEKGYQFARHAFHAKNFEAAIKIYSKNIGVLEKTHLANEEEEQRMKNYLIKMYLELALCYNKVKNPQKTCIAIRELEKLQSIGGNIKALFAKAKAKMMLNDFGPARRLYQFALTLEPNSQKILAAIKELDECEAANAQYAVEKNQLEQEYEREALELNFEINPMVEKYLKSLEN